MTSVDLSIAALLVTVIFSSVAARRAAYDRVLGAVDLIGHAEAGQARHQLGTLTFAYASDMESGRSFEMSEVDRDHRIADLFTILTVAIRLNAVRSSLGPLARGPQRLLVESAGNWVEFWVRQVTSGTATTTQLRAIADGLGAQLDDADQRALHKLRDAWL